MLLLAQAVRTRAVETLPFYKELAEMMTASAHICTVHA